MPTGTMTTRALLPVTALAAWEAGLADEAAEFDRWMKAQIKGDVV